MQDHDSIDASPAFARHLKALGHEDLQELGPLMAELEATRGWEIVCDLLARERSAQMQSLVAEAGRKSEQEYARALGELKGLQALAAAMETVKQKSQQADNALRLRLAGAAAEE